MACTVGRRRRRRRRERKITGRERRVDYCGVAITLRSGGGARSGVESKIEMVSEGISSNE
jgi:hypothetical protein